MFDPNSYLSFPEFFLDHETTHPSAYGLQAEAVPVIVAGSEEKNKGKEEVDENLQDVKGKKEQKRQRPERYAFMTKSEVDHLEDGYRWRKYGQKAVKNSAYPRSYYRCTTQKCAVKKRVERSFEDPSTVITTYEGQHNHHIPLALRGYGQQNLGFDPRQQVSQFPEQGGVSPDNIPR